LAAAVSRVGKSTTFHGQQKLNIILNFFWQMRGYVDLREKLRLA
jgi:hypothetical protein